MQYTALEGNWIGRLEGEPDGHLHLASGHLASPIDAPEALEIFDLRTSSTESIPGSEDLFSPRWSPDGRYIAALSLSQRSVRIFDEASHTWATGHDRTSGIWDSSSSAPLKMPRHAL